MENHLDEAVAIKIEGLKKKYRLGQLNTGTLVHDLQSWWARVWHKEDPNLKIDVNADWTNKEFWALNGIDLTIAKGETIGIIGANGAGKSTLLKIVSHITAPTEGQVLINGRISSMLEVGTGFNPEMTGRENIYINGAILGMTKAEIDSKIDSIIEFSECEDFIDTPVKRYSSGMYVKLAFSVASHLDNEIVIMDEVLAVGDIRFQKKCTDKMRSLSEQNGRTILFVSHSIASIRQVCHRVVVLEKGLVAFDGDTESAIEYYVRKDGMEETDVDLANMTRGDWQPRARLIRLRVQDRNKPIYRQGEIMPLLIDWEALEHFDALWFTLTVKRADEVPVGRAYSKQIADVQANVPHQSAVQLDVSALMPGRYDLMIELVSVDKADGRTTMLDGVVRGYSFQIQETNSLGAYWNSQSWGSMLLPELQIRTRQ